VGGGCVVLEPECFKRMLDEHAPTLPR
jgi:hypothetical protein